MFAAAVIRQQTLGVGVPATGATTGIVGDFEAASIGQTALPPGHLFTSRANEAVEQRAIAARNWVMATMVNVGVFQGSRRITCLIAFA